MLRGVQRHRGGGAFLWLLMGILLGGTVGAAAVYLVVKREKGPGGNPRLGQAEELAMVPTDAVAFVHIRARDLWKSEILTEFRSIVEKAGPEALTMLDEGFTPAPSSLDRVTLVLLQNPTQPANPIPQPKQEPNKQPTPPVIPKKSPPKTPQVPGVPEPLNAKPLFEFPDKIEPIGIFVFSTSYDEGKVKATLVPNAETKEIGKKTYWVDSARDLAVYAPSNTVLVVGTAQGVHQFLTRQTIDGKQPDGPLTSALALATSGKRQIVAAINARHFHFNLQKLDDEFKDLPVNGLELVRLAKDAEPLLHTDAYAIGLALMGQDDSKIDIHAYFKDDKEAEEGEKAVRALTEFAHKKLAEPKKHLEETLKGPPVKSKARSLEDLPQAIGSLIGLGVIKKVDEYLINPPLKLDGKELYATIEMPGVSTASVGASAAAIGMLFPAVSKVREAAGKMRSSNNLKQIGLAMLNYEAAFGTYPPSGSLNKADPNQLSWRVQILPFVGEGALFNQFKQDEPWDGPNNKKLIELMPKIYASPNAIAPPGQTFYKVFSGNGAIFGPGKKTKILEVTDGISSTILAIEGGDPVIWTKPEDISFDPKQALPPLSLMGKRQINVLLADASVRVIDLNRVSQKTLKAAIGMNEGEELGADWEEK